MIEKTYAQLMGEHTAHLILKLDTSEPIELGAFVGAFTSLANEFDRFVKVEHPDLRAEAQIFVREVRAGCIEADMFPYLATMAPLVTHMDTVLIIEDFVRRWGLRLGAFIQRRKSEQASTPNEIKDFINATEAIARDPNGSARLEAATFEDGKKEVKVAFQFATPEARIAQAALEERKREITQPESTDWTRVLMVFTRSDVSSVAVGVRSGELVLIEDINKKPLSLMYGSQLAEERIKYEIREADDNIYKKGFVVDVKVQTRQGRAVAYAVTHVHQVIDLPGDD